MRRYYDTMLTSIEFGGWIHRAVVTIGSGDDERSAGCRVDGIGSNLPRPASASERRRMWRECVRNLRRAYG